MSLASWTKFADFNRMNYDNEGLRRSIPSYLIEYNREENPKENKDMNDFAEIP